MSKKVVIVGGVAGGATAATRLRRLDEKAEIIIFEKDEFISFANCGLPYYIGDVITDRSKLLMQTPEGMNDKFNLDIRIKTKVIGVDVINKKVFVENSEKGKYEESYDYLLLSPGAKATRPGIPGIESKKIFTLRNIPDMDKIREMTDIDSTKSAVVVGGGFIGVEMAENLKERGFDVKLVEAAPHILVSLDPDMSKFAEKELADNGVKIYLNSEVKEFKEVDDKIQVIISNGEKMMTDMVIMAIGVTPETGFLKDSGLEFGSKGHIIVDENLKTNIDNVYAVGDAIEVVDYVTKLKTAIPLAGPANKQGRIAADNIAGKNVKYNGTQGTSVLKVFDLSVACTGANERNLKRAGIEYKTFTTHPTSHASYYPGGLQMTLKLIIDTEGKVLGAQGVGYEGVDKRIDVIATVIRLNGTIKDLTELELSYAPPFSSAKDPVNMLGYVGENLLNNMSNLITPEQLSMMKKDDYILLDIRSTMEFENGHVEGALNVPLETIRSRLIELDKGKDIVLYCRMGLNGYTADRILTQNGFKVYNITGGYKSASMFDYNVEKAEIMKNEKLGTKLISTDDFEYNAILDACGLSCPGPLMQVKIAVDNIKDGEILKATASDVGFYEDVKAWCKRTGNELIGLKKEGGIIIAYIKKGLGEDNIVRKVGDTGMGNVNDNKTIIVFSGDLDKAIASFIIANGAASMGKKVTMFFTFWGLNVLRRPKKVSVKKNFIEKMFGMMMPRGTKKLKLSRMSMMGMGGKMIRGIMKSHNVLSLEELISSAMASGVEVVACQMSMDLMGIKEQELIEGVKLGGVGYYLGEAEESNVNLFI